MRVPEWAKESRAGGWRSATASTRCRSGSSSRSSGARGERVLENEFIDRSVALAAKAFVSLFPALIVGRGLRADPRAQLDSSDDHAPCRAERRRPRDRQGRVSSRRTTSARRPASSV